MTQPFPTYPYHELGVAPDHRCLAELQRETKGIVEELGDTRLSLSLGDIPLGLKHRACSRGTRWKATVITLHPSWESGKTFAIKADSPPKCS